MTYGWSRSFIDTLTRAVMRQLGVTEATTCSYGAETRPTELWSATNVGLVQLQVTGDWGGVEANLNAVDRGPWRAGGRVRHRQPARSDRRPDDLQPGFSAWRSATDRRSAARAHSSGRSSRRFSGGQRTGRRGDTPPIRIGAPAHVQWPSRAGAGTALPTPALRWPLAGGIAVAARSGRDVEATADRLLRSYLTNAVSAAHHIGCGVTSPLWSCRQ